MLGPTLIGATLAAASTVAGTVLAGTAVSAGAAAAAGTYGWAARRRRSRRTSLVGRTFPTPGGVARVAGRAELAACPRWPVAFANQRKDSRYFEVVEETILQGFDYLYLLLEDAAGTVRAVQPFFLLDQDLLAGTGKFPQAVVGTLRKVVPKLLTARTLMVGCAAGEGHLDDGTRAKRAWAAAQMHAALKPLARAARCGLVVLKEFHAEHRDALDVFISANPGDGGGGGDGGGRGGVGGGFTRVPSLPMTRLNIDYPDFDAYMAKALSKVTRKGLRRKFRDAEAAADPIMLEVLTDVSAVADEVHALYLNVYHRSTQHFEKLTPDFLRELGRRAPDKARFFVWRQNGKAVAFSACLVNGDTIYDEYLGLDYAVALDLHLYFYTFRDIVSWAMREGYKWYASSALNYDPKLHFKCELVPLDLYVAHTNGVANAVLKRVLPWLEPTRGDPTLRKFANYADLWGTGR
jgi:hypothetical protein